ncbi:MAG: aldo/keto reductase [Candidatus Aminicenantes bacterium]|nr:aldo/keto reductase [Candidatus Aminicenantes bacterium]
MSKPSAINRRKFISRSVSAAVGAGVAGFGGTAAAQTAPPAAPAPAESKIRGFRTLGRTGFRVSDISTGFCNNSAVLKAIFAAGVNYVDTAESYGNQRAIGQALPGLDRKSLFITSKLEIETDASKENFLRRFAKCLEELQTDYIDCLMMHMPERAELLATPGFHQAMEQLKKEGKLRFCGVSHHGPNWFRAPEESMEKVLLAAAADGRFDVFLMAYNFLQREAGQKVLEACAAKKIGVTLMKVNPAGKYQGLKDRVEALKKEGKEVDPLYIEGRSTADTPAGSASRAARTGFRSTPSCVFTTTSPPRAGRSGPWPSTPSSRRPRPTPAATAPAFASGPARTTSRSRECWRWPTTGCRSPESMATVRVNKTTGIRSKQMGTVGSFLYLSALESSLQVLTFFNKFKIIFAIAKKYFDN